MDRQRQHGLPPALCLSVLAAILLLACSPEPDAAPQDPGPDVQISQSAPAPAEDPDGAAGGGTVIFGTGQEPVTLNPLIEAGDTTATARVLSHQFPGAYTLEPDLTFTPEVIDGEAVITEDPFSVTYTLREDARWSDSAPISAHDLAWLYETVTTLEADGVDEVRTPPGYDLITDYTIGDRRTITFNFREPYAAWRTLFSTILPAHVLEGEDPATMLADGLPPVSGGPYVFDGWNQGTELRLVRNDDYWGDPPALDALVFRFIPDATTLTRLLIAGELDASTLEPDAQDIARLEAAADAIEFAVGPGPVWEHLDFNTRVPGLDRRFVREAIAMGIDRERIVERVIRPVDPAATVLQNPFWLAGAAAHRPAFERWSHAPAAARDLLAANGCEAGDDPVFVCDGVRLSFRLGTTAGNDRREQTQRLVQEDLSDIGIETIIDNDPGALFFDRLDTPQGCGGRCDFDLAIFPWRSEPNPMALADAYGCDEGEEGGEGDEGDEGEPRPRERNFSGWCAAELTAVMDAANDAVSSEANARLWNEAAQLLATQMPVLPLYQHPSLLAWDTRLTGPQLHPTAGTHLWNSHTWAYAP